MEQQLESPNSLEKPLLPDNDIELKYRRQRRSWEPGQGLFALVSVSLLFYIAVLLTIQLSGAGRCQCKDGTEHSSGLHLHHDIK